MTWVKAIELFNYGPFRGLNRIELGRGVYGVTARHVRDPRVSNTVGKSSLLHVIPHVMYGSFLQRTEDGWITNGCDHGRATLFLSDGSMAEIERRRGKSTQVRVRTAGQGLVSGKAARVVMRQVVGLGEQDFFATRFFRQKQASRFVTMQPADRMKIAIDWFELARVQELVREAVDLNAAAVEALTAHDAKLAALRERVAGFDREALEKRKAEAEGKKVRAEKQIAKKNEGGKDAERLARAREFERISDVGERLREQLDEIEEGMPERPSEELLEAARATKAEAYEALRQARKGASGEFDGTCPVAGIACPAADEIRSGCAEAKRLLEAAEGRHQEAEAEHARLRVLEDEWRERERLRADRASRIDQLAERALELLPDHRWARERGLLGESAEAAQEGLGEGEARQQGGGGERAPEADLAAAVAEIALVGRELGELGGLEEELGAQGALRGALVGRAELTRAGVACWRKALQAVTERPLREIERRANGLLASAGIGLEVELRQEREGQGLATNCDACGWPFPTSARVKECGRCGEARGPKVIEELGVELSRVSGGAQDMAGLAIQLSAGAWLASKRGAAWGLVEVDEPFGELDEHNGPAMAQEMARVVRGQLGVEQAFVTAHSSVIMEAMPCRVVLVADDDGTYFEGGLRKLNGQQEEADEEALEEGGKEASEESSGSGARDEHPKKPKRGRKRA